jgi:hypothetical protein
VDGCLPGAYSAKAMWRVGEIVRLGEESYVLLDDLLTFKRRDQNPDEPPKL